MTSELVLPDGNLVNPVTGELVAHDDPAAVARLANELQEIAEMLRDARAYCTALLVDASRLAGTKTLRFQGGYTVEIRDTAKSVEWDFDTLAGLVALGLPQERYDELVRPTVSYTVDGRVARSVAAANPDYARVIEAARTETPRPAYVKVTRGK